MRLLVTLLFCFLITPVRAQTSFAKQINQFRQAHKTYLLERSSREGPMKSEQDVAYMRFYEPDSAYRVLATVELTPEAKAFKMPTYNGQTQPHIAYAVLTFVLKGTKQQLTVYRDLVAITYPQHQDALFLPFKDATAGGETYGGGRYIDLSTADIQANHLTLDFNKAYNPYCAYHEGYACPIPPKTNVLAVPIKAGEKVYGKAH